MPRRKAVNGTMLLNMVHEGATQKEIMEKLDIKASPQFKVAYLNAAMESGMIPKVKGGRGAKEKGPIKRDVSVNKRGTIVIPKEVVGDLGFKEGDVFEAKRSRGGITLVASIDVSSEEPPATKLRKKQGE